MPASVPKKERFNDSDRLRLLASVNMLKCSGDGNVKRAEWGKNLGRVGQEFEAST